MKVFNRGAEAHKLSHKGEEYLLAPGNHVELELTHAEAKAMPSPFEATGTPIKAPKAEQEKKA
ncbi:hypothetical protein [Mesorhizobium jarvisii]|uniref:hypothetical protein n=1 Tax=Mesorhizobium jarvisii TaxID=1777867 RepID=UPI00049B53FB|nr:hypothetical protein [Mesorhizobium jarvisii]AID29251.1 hypothetical protein MCHK_1426 [Mesorhizobium huakuii 7653R]MCH4560863.1 hypothetical protein [Mesorhizobium jarvisii]